MKDYARRFLSKEQVQARIAEAAQKGLPFALTRIGNGEAEVLSHDILVPATRVGSWVGYAGAPRLPDYRARDELIDAILGADIVGLSDEYKWDCAPLIEKICEILDLRPEHICSARVNWHLHEDGSLYEALGGKRTVVVGRRAAEAVDGLIDRGVNVVGTCSLEGWTEMNDAYLGLRRRRKEFDIALIAAGIPATVLSVRVARYLGKVAIDYGHVIDDVIEPGFGVQKLDATKDRWEVGMKKALESVHYPDGALIQGAGPKIYLVIDARKRHITTPHIFRALGLNGHRIMKVSQQELDLIPSGPPI